MITLEQHLEAHQYIDTYDGWEACDCGWREEQERRFEGSIFTHAAHVAATWREARTVRTVEELDALPESSLLRDASGTLGIPASQWPEHGVFPALVLWTPEDGEA